MFRNVEGVMEFCTKEDIKFIDFKISDFSGKWHHLSIPADKFCEKVITDGIGFDGSSYGLLTVEKSDMVFIPDINTAFIDPFCRYKTLSMIGNIYTLDKGIKRYENDPRYIAEKAEKYMHQTGIADENIIGPEFEFYIFDHISYNISPNNISMNIDSAQAEWNAKNEDVANLGYKVPHKGGYHIGLPYDVTNDIRSQMSLMLESLGIPVKYHHHESGGPGQVEIEVESGSMKDMADKTLILKYVVKNTAIQNSKSVTFMPKPILGEAGNGMHVHMQLFKEGQPLFYNPDGYSGLSKTALYYIGGILKHTPSLLAFTNPSTNSYKRLVPGYEAPVSICFATSNRSSVIRVPGYANRPENKRFEFRSSDATCNPYLAYSALLMAGLDGIQNKIDPVKEGYGPYDINLYNLSEEEKNKIKALPKSLHEAAGELEKDYSYLLEGGVFTKELISRQLDNIRQAHKYVDIIPHPVEFQLYYDL